MSWEHEFAQKMNDHNNDGYYRDGCYLIGHVLSPHLDGSGPLIISILNGQAMLTKDMVDRICRTDHLREGMIVAVIPGPRALRGGQRYLVMETPGHGDLLGRDAEDCHPIEAITGLRGELDDHHRRLVHIETARLPDIENRRLPDLETNRVPALEHNMNDSNGKVPLMSAKVDEMWDWYIHHRDNNGEG